MKTTGFVLAVSLLCGLASRIYVHFYHEPQSHDLPAPADVSVPLPIDGFYLQGLEDKGEIYFRASAAGCSAPVYFRYFKALDTESRSATAYVFPKSRWKNYNVELDEVHSSLSELNNAYRFVSYRLKKALFIEGPPGEGYIFSYYIDNSCVFGADDAVISTRKIIDALLTHQRAHSH